jgi:hypothetical protein
MGKAKEASMADQDRRLATHGSDFSRWPGDASEAREALLREPKFRRAWEEERDLDRRLAAGRDEIDAEIARSGALARLGRLSERHAPAGFLAGIPWGRVAAGVLIAGMLGGALDYLVLPQSAAEPIDLALVDPLDTFDNVGSR